MAKVIERSDRQMLETLRRGRQMTVDQLSTSLSVTATAIRQRLDRLVAAGAVSRQEVRAGRGRPSHHYTLTEAGEELLGNNLADLARVMWSEISALEDESVRSQLLQRISQRLSEQYAAEVVGTSEGERLQSLAGFLRGKAVSAVVEQIPGQELPVLKITGCPYPGLSGADQHEICEVEQQMLSELVGQPIRLTDCRCHSPEGICTFVLERDAVK